MRRCLVFLILCSSTLTVRGQNLYEYYLVKGSSKIAGHEYESAVYYLDKAIERYPDSADAWFNRGGAHYFLLDMEAALRDFNKALELDPENIDVYKWRGMIHHQLLDYDKAESDYAAYLKNKDELFIHLKLAELHLSIKNVKAAEKSLESLKERGQKNANYHNVQGLLYEEKQLNDKAYSAFSTAIALDGEQAIFYMNRARLLKTLGRDSEACNDWKTAAKLGVETALEMLVAAQCP